MSQEYPQFDTHFKAAIDLARWNEASCGPNGYNAWFYSDHIKDGGTEIPGQYETVLVKLIKIVPLAGGGTPMIPDVGVNEPLWMSENERVSVRLTHAFTKIAADGSSTERTEQVDRRLRRRNAWNWRSPLVSYLPALVGRVCVRWCRLADSFDDLASTVNVYADWMTADRAEGSPADNSRLGTVSLQRSFVIAERDDLSYGAAAPYVDALTQLDPENENHRAVRNAVGLTLRAALLNQPATRGEVKHTFTPVTQKLATEAVTLLDRQDVLTPGWWMGTVTAAGAITIPALLPLVHEKLAGDSGADIIAKLSPLSSQATIKTYVATLINAYAQDPTRDRAISSKIQKIVLDIRGAADLIRLINIANGIIKNEDKELAPEDRRPLLNPRRMYDVGDALLLVLEKTRPASASNEAWAAQFDQDVLHAEIIDILHASLSPGRTAAIREQLVLHSLHLRYPWADRKTLETIRGELTSGQTPASVRAKYRARQHSVVSAWRAKKPGDGLLS